jgi:hypothetical protein
MRFSAEVAELADAQASGACARKGVKVRVLSSAPIEIHHDYGEPRCGTQTWR